MGPKINDFGVPGQTSGTEGTCPNGLAREGILISWQHGSGFLAAWVRIPGVWVRQLRARFGGISKVLILDTQMLIFWCLWHAQNVAKV